MTKKKETHPLVTKAEEYAAKVAEARGSEHPKALDAAKYVDELKAIHG